MGAIVKLQADHVISREEASNLLPNVHFEGPEDEQRWFLDLTSRALRTNVGTLLFHEIVTSSAQLTIKSGVGNNHCKGVVTLANMNHSLNSIVYNEHGDKCVEKINPELQHLIAFVHELCHFIHVTRKTVWVKPVDYDFGTYHEHLAIEGISPFPFSENRLRIELGLPERASHLGTSYPPASDFLKGESVTEEAAEEALESYTNCRAAYDFKQLFLKFPSLSIRAHYLAVLFFRDKKIAEFVLQNGERGEILKNALVTLSSWRANKDKIVTILSDATDWSARILKTDLTYPFNHNQKERIEVILKTAYTSSAKMMKKALTQDIPSDQKIVVYKILSDATVHSIRTLQKDLEHATWQRFRDKIDSTLTDSNVWAAKTLKKTLFPYHSEDMIIETILEKTDWSTENLQEAFSYASDHSQNRVVDTILTKADGFMLKSKN